MLSQGDRPDELNQCLTSVLAQVDVTLDLVVVGNGWEPTGLPAGVRTHALAENVGIPGGRNIGASVAVGDLVCFIDDDAWIADPRLFARIAERFAASRRIGSVQPHVSSADGTTMRRWVPRLWVGDPSRPGPGFTIAECVMVVRREAFEDVGGWPAHFFYGHEGIDLAWRLWDGGWDVYYAGDLSAHHPATLPARHAVFYRHNARNRVWVARRNLPAALVPIYLSMWVLVTVARLADKPRALLTWSKGFVEGWRTDPGPRHPMRWATVARLARLGHPPVI